MMRWRTAAATAALVGALLLALIGFHSRSRPVASAVDADIANPNPTTESTKQPGPGASATAIKQPPPAPLPDSFRNTDVDGRVSVDDNDRIVPTRALRDLFDYYLSGVGEYAQSDVATAVKTRLRDYARDKRLSNTTREQLVALFDHYMAYRRAAAAYIKQAGTLETAQALQNLSDMRIAYLGAEMAGAFYGNEERLARATIARRQNHAGAGSLTATQSKALAPVDLANRVETLRKNGANEAAVAAARERAVGRTAAERLDALDTRRAQWNTKLDAYRAEHDRLMASGMAASDRQKALSALRERHFSARDIRRVEAIDRLAERHAESPSE